MMKLKYLLLLSLFWMVKTEGNPCDMADLVETSPGWMENSPNGNILPNENDARGTYMSRKSVWFRLKGEGGTEILTETPSSLNRCHANYPGWITGELPTNEGEETNAVLCHLYPTVVIGQASSTNCHFPRQLSIHKCSGYFVYKFREEGDSIEPGALFCTQKSNIKPEIPDTGRPSACASNPCAATGKCFDTPSGFQCVCSLGYTGVYCQTNIDDCASSLCLYGGICVDRVNSYKCVCSEGFKGKNCEIKEKEEPSPCKTTYRVETKPEWMKKSSNSYIPPEDSQNDPRARYMYKKSVWFRLKGDGGTEILTETPPSLNRCHANFPGWITGKLPTNEGDETTDAVLCHLYPTVSIGQASPGNCHFPRLLSIHKCSGYFVYKFREEDKIIEPGALFCIQNSKIKPEIPDTGKPSACASNPCAESGKCFDTPSGFQCVCSPGYTDVYCQTNIDDCASSPCLHGGTCSDDVNSYTCVCPEGFKGKGCEINVNDCLSNFCENGGICMDGNNGHTCLCALGYSGANCETNEDNCGAFSHCKNGGTCNDEVNSYTCQCSDVYEGKNCEIAISKCRSGPCKNGGTCSGDQISYQCACKEGFVGRNCETRLDHCDSKPCKNGGRCTSLTSSYKCVCLPGWSGSTCEDDSTIRKLVDKLGDLEIVNGRFSYGDLYNKIEHAINKLTEGDSGTETDSLGDRLGKKVFNSISKYLEKKFRKALDSGIKKLSGKSCGSFDLGMAANGFKKGYEKCLKKRQKKCRDEGKKERDKVTDSEENEKEETEKENKDDKDKIDEEIVEEEEKEKENEGCSDECPAIENISNGKHEGLDFDCGKSVKFSCDDGYEISGCATDDCKVTCERGGTWSSKLPTCEKKSCGGLITLTSSNPQIILNIPKSDLNNKVNCIWFVVTESEEEINVDFPQSFKSSNCKERFVEIASGNIVEKVCQTRNGFQKSFPDLVKIRYHHDGLSQPSLSARVSIIKDYYKTPKAINSLLRIRSTPAKKPKLDLNCKVQLNYISAWPKDAPILVDKNTFDPILPKDDSGYLDLTGEFRASCGTARFNTFDTSFLTVSCSKKNGKMVVSYSKRTIQGSRSRQPKSKTVSESGLTFDGLGCIKPAVVTTDGVTARHSIGWVLEEKLPGGTTPKRFNILNDIHFDSARKIPERVSHTLRGKTLHWTQGDSNRPKFTVTPPAVDEADQMDPDQYPMKDQKSMFGAINENLVSRIDCCNDNYLVHGHLAPNADFLYKSWRAATFHMTNVAPQWQGINAGNWKTMEGAIRKYAKVKNRDLQITTGTYGTLELNGKKIETSNFGVTIPSHFWKVVTDPVTSESIAFVIDNNPFNIMLASGLPQDSKCSTQCSLLQGKLKMTPKKGLLVCCHPDDLHEMINDVSPTGDNELLDTDLKTYLSKIS